MDQEQNQTNMSAVAPAPARALTPVRELLDRTFQIFQANIRHLSKLSLLLIVPYVVLASLMLVMTGSTGLGSGSSGLAGSIGFILVIVMIYLGLVWEAGILLMIKEKNFSYTIKELFDKAKPYVWKMFVVGLITGILVILWSVLLIIPGIIFGIYYALSIYALINEDKTGYSALKRSKQLVKGYWWALLGRIILVQVLYMILVYILSWPAGLIEDKNLSAIWSIIISAAEFIVAPFAMIYISQIYQELADIKGSVPENN